MLTTVSDSIHVMTTSFFLTLSFFISFFSCFLSHSQLWFFFFVYYDNFIWIKTCFVFIHCSWYMTIELHASISIKITHSGISRALDLYGKKYRSFFAQVRLLLSNRLLLSLRKQNRDFVFFRNWAFGMARICVEL